MRNTLKKIRKNKKGFTLTELIVVMVILAILAAATIPTMLGFIGDAREKAMYAQVRTVYLAAQATYTEEFGVNVTYDATGTNEKNAAVADIVSKSEIDAADGIKITVSASTGKVTEVIFFRSASGMEATFDVANNDITVKTSGFTVATTDRVIATVA